MTSLYNQAFARLRERAREAAQEPWRPGKQPSDDEIIHAYILKLETELTLLKDELFLQRSEFRT